MPIVSCVVTIVKDGEHPDGKQIVGSIMYEKCFMHIDLDNGMHITLDRYVLDELARRERE